jgi:serine/threonine-protein kinase
VEPVPTTIGRYVVERLVGTGAMGRIYKAHDPDIRRTVAIKLISTNLMSSADRTNYIRRFRREAEAAARCVHPNIVTIYDFALHEGEPFLAMEFVQGASLRQVLDESPVMPILEAIGVMLQVLDALAIMHAQGVIHQDIKPANIMLTSDKKVKVGDFGVSRIANTDVTTTFATAGTPSYMSPEQCRGADVDGRSDLFAAGAALFEMVSGEHAFPGRSVTEVTYRIQNEGLPLLPAEVRRTAPRLPLVLERATAKHPDDRFDSATDMAEALKAVLANLSDNGTRPRSGAAAAESALAPTVRVVAPAPAGSAPFEPALLSLVEERLKSHVGPIAPVLLRAAANRSRSAEELCAELARSIGNLVERQEFVREFEQAMRLNPSAAPTAPPGGGATVGSRLPDQELERARAALTEFVGPIARILVRQAAAKASSVEALWQDLSQHLQSPAERAAFLRQRER